MSGRYDVLSRCADRQHQTGTAIILAMMTVALLAGLAAFVIRDYGRSVASVSGHHDQDQARLLARGAIDWARNVLAEDARVGNVDYPGEEWAIKVPPTPVEDGEVSGEIADMSGRFDLNSLVRDGIVDAKQFEAYERLLVLLGFPTDHGAALASSLASRIQANTGAQSSGYSGNGNQAGRSSFLVDVDELSLVQGYDAAVLERLKSFVVALPEPAPLNVNTASPEVLAATLPNLSLDDARQLTAAQQIVPYKDIGVFLARMRRSGANPDKSRIAVTSRYFLASGRAHYGDATTRMQVLLDRKNAWARIVWQKIL